MMHPLQGMSKLQLLSALKFLNIKDLLFLIKKAPEQTSIKEILIFLIKRQNINNISRNNIKIVFAEIDDQTGLISLDSVKKKLSKKTKAIIPVNLYGQKVNIENLRKIVGKNVFIIEDSAQSHFSSTCKDCSKKDHEFCYKNEILHSFNRDSD